MSEDKIAQYEYPNVQDPLKPLVPVWAEEKVEFKNYKRTPTIGKLVSALCKAQLEFTPVKKESENPAFSRPGRVSKYADLFNLVSATRPALNKYGLAVLQFPNVIMGSKVLVVETLLVHESDEWVSCEIHLPAADERGYTAHSIGKAITYARRFSWGPIIAAVAEDDDDGNEASGQGTREQAQAVGQAKIDALKAVVKAEASLFYALQPSGKYAITGDENLMRKIYKQFRKEFAEDKEGRFYMLSDEQLEVLKFQCEQSHIPLMMLKGPDGDKVG